MRKCSYYNYKRRSSFIWKLIYHYYHLKYIKLGQKLSIYIEYDSMGYGVVLPHLGSIVIGPNEIGNYAVIFQDTTISGNHKVIGNALFLAAGAKITKKVVMGNNVSVSANSVVLQSYGDNVLLAGMPAVIKRTDYPAWYVKDGFTDKVERVELLKQQMGVD